MQAIIAWMRANPDGGKALMRENLCYIFFKELTGPGRSARSALPVTPRATVAADPTFVPLGAPVFLTLDRPEADGLWVAQDTGGAIKGANRFDTFWGAGAEATRTAGGMSANGPGADPAAQGQRRARALLSPEEAELWAQVTATIRPLSREPLTAETCRAAAATAAAEPQAARRRRRARKPLRRRPRPEPGNTLDGSWDRKLRSGIGRSPTASSTFTATISTAPGRRSTVALERAIDSRRPGAPADYRPCPAGRAAGPARAHPRRRPRLARGVPPRAADRRGPGRASPPRRGRQPLHHPSPPLNPFPPAHCTFS